ncbi:hypothetical protein G9G54_04845 [Paenibacillus sp. EKM212P]|uniref:hypothetical protein n=1 Tax=Paenibacillus sp. EKM212P TaxID=1683680 RepID=UPI0013EDB6B9|nr:hypothetical protein [Paenibacillus sp. EKM212P]KAF6581623.1 hypothetical protein G9G54_04845 [Paenibacillus sp. EKM212P]
MKKEHFSSIRVQEYFQVTELLTANSDKTDKVISILRTYTSCMIDSALQEGFDTLSDSALYLHSKNVVATEKLQLLVIPLENKRIAEIRAEEAEATRKFNEKYFVPSIGMSAEKVLESTWEGNPTI